MTDSIKSSTGRSGSNPEQRIQDGYRAKIEPIAKRSIEQRCFRIQGDCRIADRLTRSAARHQESDLSHAISTQKKTDLSQIKEKAEQVCEEVQGLVNNLIGLLERR
ncbi:MAG: hypothetical protein C5B47_07520 [Verrucomicrobia bacterium]|nr:MAG: hypothetical protein C5B47_07520 [Verrucomicrobiota bacterium]